MAMPEAVLPGESPDTAGPLGILAGGGSLPREIADQVKTSGRRVHIVAIGGEGECSFGEHSFQSVNWGGIGRLLANFRQAGVRDLIIIGRVRRPDPWRVKPDLGFFTNLPTLLRLMASGGDDGVMRGVVRFFEAHGFRVVGPADVAPWLFVPEGPLGLHAAAPAALRDIALGLSAVRRLGAFDIGQGVVVTDGRIEAIEGAEGTDAMLARVARRRNAIEQAAGAGGQVRRGVLVKRTKPGQEPRVDVPAIGPETVLRAAEAGLSGLALEAGQVITAERARLIARADMSGLFVQGVGDPRGTGADDAGRRAARLAGRAAPAWVSGPPATDRGPSPADLADAGLGLAVARDLIDLDVARTVVVSRGHVLAVEALEGAGDLLARAARLRQWNDRRSARRRGVAVLRHQQALEAELVDSAAEAGLAGLVVTGEPPRALAIARADAAGMFIVVEPSAPEGNPSRIQAGTSLGNTAQVQACRVFIVTGEHSGDALGAALMRALAKRLPGGVTFQGVGGHAMADAGLTSIFPLDDVAVMGLLAIVSRLPKLIARVHTAVAAALAWQPDAVVIIDAPEFTHPIAKRIRKAAPHIPIIDYVSPTVWAWRPGRAKKMRPYVDHLLALLPFEPAAHARLGGPPCTYVGHPLVERLDWLNGVKANSLAARLGLDASRPVLVVLPGSRANEVERLMSPFGETVARLESGPHPPHVIIPVVDGMRDRIEQRLREWPAGAGSRVHLVAGEADKFAAFKLARAALAASGTVTLELALSGTPMVVAYRVDAVSLQLRFLVKVPSIVLANLVLGENAFPEFIQEDCVPDRLAPALAALMAEGPDRDKQLKALVKVGQIMRAGAIEPSERAADVVMPYLAGRRDL